MHPLVKLLIEVIGTQVLLTIYLIESAHFRHGIFRLRYLPLLAAAVLLAWICARLIFNIAPLLGAL